MRSNEVLERNCVALTVVSKQRLVAEVVASALADLVGPSATVTFADSMSSRPSNGAPPDHAARDEMIVDVDDVDVTVVVHTERGFETSNEDARKVRVASLEQLVRLVVGGAIGEASPTSSDWRAGAERSTQLTDRELEILLEMRSGRDNEEVAITLGISAHTVRSHVGNILRKSGTSSRVAAIAFVG